MTAPATGALLMKVYGPGVANPLPGENTLAKDIEFVGEKYRSGESYNIPARLGLEQGVTHNTDHGAFTLESAVDGTYGSVSLDGAEIAIRATVSYGEMSKLSQSKGRSSRAFDQGIGVKIANLMDSGEQRRDMMLWYGSGSSGLTNIGVVNAVAVAASTGVVTINLTRESWITGFWQDFAKGKVDVYTTGGTLINTTGAMQVTGVTASTCRVQLTGATADAAAIAAGHVLFFRGARAASMVGIQAICENTGSLFGIDASVYPQWKAVSYPVGGTLNFDKVAEGLSAAADNGLKEGCTLYVCGRTWTDLLTDEVALRRYMAGGEKKARPGFNELEFIMNCGPVKIKTHRYMKQGLAFAIPTQEFSRIGSTDLTFTLPGQPDEFFFKQLENAAGSELRIYSDQAVFTECPYHAVVFSTIANTADNLPS